MTTNDATPREADRAVPEPDAERVEAAAKALHDEDMKGFEDDASLPWVLVRPRWLRMARASLAAAGDDWLDAIHPDARVNVGQSESFEVDRYTAFVEWPTLVGYYGAWKEKVVGRGTGPTRKAAVLNAVAKAKGASDDTH